MIGVLSTVAMFWVRAGDWKLGLLLFMLGNIAVAASIVFYESLLPHLVSESELDRVSSAGYAIGYLGGGVLLAVNLLMIQRPAWFGIPDAGTAVRLSLASVGIWWFVFSIPLFRKVPEPARRIEAGETEGGSLVGTGAPASRGNLPRAAPLQTGLPAARRLSRLQRRHPDDHPDGNDVRQPDWHRPERDDHGAPHHAVHRRALCVSLRNGRRNGSAPRPQSSSASASMRSSSPSATT